MECMKCGTKAAGKQVFCDTCLAEMERYPVKPGTAIHIPARPSAAPAKKAASKKKAVAPEVQVKRQKKLIRWLIADIVLMMIALGLAFYLLIQTDGFQDAKQTIGENYHIQLPGESD